MFEDLGKCGSALWKPRFPGWIPSQRRRKERKRGNYKENQEARLRFDPARGWTRRWYFQIIQRLILIWVIRRLIERSTNVLPAFEGGWMGVAGACTCGSKAADWWLFVAAERKDCLCSTSLFGLCSFLFRAREQRTARSVEGRLEKSICADSM